jgi:hypothetical protein
MASQVLASGEAEIAWRVASAEESLTFSLSGGRICISWLGLIIRALLINVVVL